MENYFKGYKEYNESKRKNKNNNYSPHQAGFLYKRKKKLIEIDICMIIST